MRFKQICHIFANVTGILLLFFICFLLEGPTTAIGVPARDPSSLGPLEIPPFRIGFYKFDRVIRYPTIPLEKYASEFSMPQQTVTTKQEVVKFTRKAIDEFQKSIVGFQKWAREQRTRLKPLTTIRYPKPLHLTGTSLTLDCYQSPWIQIDFYDVKLYGLDNIHLDHIGSYPIIKTEHSAVFRITGVSALKSVILCGRHSLKNVKKEISLDGKFCYQMTNFTYRSHYSKVRLVTGAVATSRIEESVLCDAADYTDFAFSTADETPSLTLAKLRIIHFNSLKTILANSYLFPVSHRVRWMVENDPRYVDEQELHVKLYEDGIIRTAIDSIKTYLKNDQLRLENEMNDDIIVLQNFAEFSRVIPTHEIIRKQTNDSLTCNVTVLVYYYDSNASINFQSNRLVVNSFSVTLIVRLANDQLDRDNTLSNVQLTNVDIDFTVDNSTPIDETSKTNIVSVIRYKISHFLTSEVLKQQN